MESAHKTGPWLQGNKNKWVWFQSKSTLIICFMLAYLTPIKTSSTLHTGPSRLQPRSKVNTIKNQREKKKVRKCFQPTEPQIIVLPTPEHNYQLRADIYWCVTALWSPLASWAVNVTPRAAHIHAAQPVLYSQVSVKPFQSCRQRAWWRRTETLVLLFTPQTDQGWGL